MALENQYRILYLGGTLVCKPSQPYEGQDGKPRISRARIDVEEGRFSSTVSPAAVRAIAKALKDDPVFKKFVEELEAANGNSV